MRLRIAVNAAWARIVLAEIYIQVLSGEARPPLIVVLKNIVPLLGAITFGARRAKALLEQAAAHNQLSDDGIIRARINMDLGLLHKLKKQPVLARQFFEKARAPAEIQGAALMVNKIDAALAGLP